MNCIFCQHDRPMLAQTKPSFALCDSFPVANGHTLVIPKRHVATIWDLTSEAYTDAFDLVRQVKTILQNKYA
jgi:diadenosine tetraphosphate (Ap4A) HIT family hydrolase